MGGGGEPVSKKTFLWPFGPRIGLKLMGGPGPPAPSLDPPPNKTQGLTMHPLFICSLDHSVSLNKLGDSARRVRWTIRNVMGVEWGKYKINIHARGK